MTPRAMSEPRSRSGVTFADVLLVLAVSGLVLSFAWPRFRRARFEHRVSHAIHAVDALRSASRQYRSQNGGAWPPGSPRGGIPPELAALLGDGTVRAADEYLLDWDRWDLLQRPAPSGEDRESSPGSLGPQLPVVSFVGSITLRTEDGALLAELVRHYGPASFARDSSWTLVVVLDTAVSPRPDSAAEEGLGGAGVADIH